MGSLQSQPIKQKIINKGQNNDIQFCSMSMQGWRSQMQVQTLQQLNIDQSKQGNSIFAVFQGRYGFQVSQFLKQTFISVLTSLDQYLEGDYLMALTNTFRKIDQLLLTDKGQRRLEQIRVQNGLQLKYENQKISKAIGALAIVVLITKQKIFIANVGNCQSALFRGEQTLVLSTSHQPFDDVQRKRIQNAGGQIIQQKINGCMPLSRSIGLFGYKENPNRQWNQQMVTACPEIKILQKKLSDKFILITNEGFCERSNMKPNQLLVKISNNEYFKQADYQKCLQVVFQQIVTSTISQLNSQKFGCSNVAAIIVKFNQI